MRLPCAGLALLLGAWVCDAAEKPPARADADRPGAIEASPWSAPSEEGLQTRLVPVTRVARAGKPVFLRLEVRHKDGKDWAQNTTDIWYMAEVIVKDQQGKTVDSTSVELGFRTRVPAGAGIPIGIFLAGKHSAALDAGAYTVTAEHKTVREMVRRGMVQLPVAGPLGFGIPRATGPVPSDAPLKPDYEQAEELRVYLKAWGGGLPSQLLEQGRAIVPGLVALVEKGDDKVSDGFPLQLWQRASFIVGRIGDRRAAAFLLKRLNDPGAMDWWFVSALGRLGVKPAVPKLVEELRTMDNRGWEANSQAYGSRSRYLVEALEQITGEKFPKDEYGNVTDRDATLKAVNAWWATQDKKKYEAAPAPPEK